MIDKNYFRRQVMILSHCLTLARAYYDQDNFKRASYYSNLADEYFREIQRMVERPELFGVQAGPTLAEYARQRGKSVMELTPRERFRAVEEALICPPVATIVDS